MRPCRTTLSALRSRDAWFQWMWRVTVLVLPWQTRWLSGASLVGWPWEQGRMAVYASWIPMVCTVALGASRVRWAIRERRELVSVMRVSAIIFSLIFIRVLLMGEGAAIKAGLQWLGQLLLLGVFVLTLWASNIEKKVLAAWLVISLVPQVVCAVVQTAAQHIVGVKWLGLSEQLPGWRGTSVIENNGVRFLRAYGGFPHPNIFGGWLAVGTVFAVWLTSMTQAWRRVGWMILSALLASTLLLTFSRTAWIATAAGLLFLLASVVRKERGVSLRQMAVPIIIPFFAFIVVLIPARRLVLTRVVATERIEQRSFDERMAATHAAWLSFLSDPWFGSGPNALLLSESKQLKAVMTAAPIQPPHNIFLLALAELGVIGLAVIGLGVRKMLKVFWFRSERSFALVGLVVFLILGSADHYLWSFWSGQALVAMLLATIFAPTLTP